MTRGNDYTIATKSELVSEANTLIDLGFTAEQLKIAHTALLTVHTNSLNYLCNGEAPSQYHGHTLHATGTYEVVSSRLIAALQICPVSAACRVTVSLLGDRNK